MGGKRTLEMNNRATAFAVHLLPRMTARRDVTAFDDAAVLASYLDCAFDLWNSDAEISQIEEGLLMPPPINQLCCSNFSLRVEKHDATRHDEGDSSDDKAASGYKR